MKIGQEIKYKCDICGDIIIEKEYTYEKLDGSDTYLHQFESTAGYGSKYDGDCLFLHICEECIDNLNEKVQERTEKEELLDEMIEDYEKALKELRRSSVNE